MDLPVTYPVHNAILASRAVEDLDSESRDLLWEACMGPEPKPAQWQRVKAVLATQILEYWREDGKDDGMPLGTKLGMILENQRIQKQNRKKSEI